MTLLWKVVETFGGWNLLEKLSWVAVMEAFDLVPRPVLSLLPDG